jgi:cell division protein ZapA
MPNYSMNVLGLAGSFKAEADQERIERARKLLEERYRQLDFSGRRISKEKLLTFLALGLADDLLQSNQRRDELEEKLARLLAKIDAA